MSYFHGVEVITVNAGSEDIQIVVDDIIFLFGIAPMGPVNTPTIVQSLNDAAQFGSQLPGFNIPSALANILAQGNTTVIVVNTFDSVANISNTPTESVTITGGIGALANAPTNSPVLTSSDGSTTYVLNTDYQIDVYGNITVLPGSKIPPNGTIEADYNSLNPTAVTNNQLIGAVSVSGQRTGLQLIGSLYSLFGYEATICICPGYSSIPAIGQAMQTLADSMGFDPIFEAPQGTTVTAAIEARGPSGNIGNFSTGSENAILCFPWVQAYSPATQTYIPTPPSSFLAGVIANVSSQKGQQYGPSNNEVEGVYGLDVPVTFSRKSTTSDANNLNAAGIVTLVRDFGTGFLIWGNRNASFPASSLPTNFISVKRVARLVDTSVQLAAYQFTDQPITQAAIDIIRNAVNAFLRKLTGMGMIVSGSCTYDPTKNPSANLANGQIVFDIQFLPPAPAELIVFNSFVNPSLYNTIS
jgi:phage tail sheath protein FI